MNYRQSVATVTTVKLFFPMDANERKKPASDADWYVAYTEPAREELVAKVVKQRSFESFIPVMTVTRRRARVTRPLFPRYVFIGTQPGRALSDLRQTPGLGGFVRSCGKVVTVPGEVMSALWDAESAGEFDFTDETISRFNAEAKRMKLNKQIYLAHEKQVDLIITKGTFRYFVGKIAAIHPDERMSLLVTILGKAKLVSVHFDEVKVRPEG